MPAALSFSTWALIQEYVFLRPSATGIAGRPAELLLDHLVVGIAPSNAFGAGDVLDRQVLRLERQR